MYGVVIKAEGLRRSFTQGEEVIEVLKGVDLSVLEGQFIAITGLSGSGKSTLLNILGLLERPDSGMLEIHREEVQNYSRRAQARFRLQKIGFIFQSYNLMNNLTVYENLILPLKLMGGVARSEMKSRATRLLELVGLVDKRDAYPHELSGGQQQRVAIARALMKQPAFILADEPTANLDERNARLIIDLLKKLNKVFGSTIILITHELPLAELADMVVALEGGVIVQYRPGTVPSQTRYADIYNSPSASVIVSLQRKLKRARFVAFTLSLVTVLLIVATAIANQNAFTPVWEWAKTTFQQLWNRH